MAILKLLRRYWGMLLLLPVVLWIFDIHPIDSTFELLGFNSRRMALVQEAGHLAPLPLERSKLRVKTSSGMMHYSTTIYFKATPEVVSHWVKDSSSLQETKPEIMPDGTIRYILYPQARGVVYVSADRTEVGINLGQAIDGPTTSSPIPPRQR